MPIIRHSCVSISFLMLKLKTHFTVKIVSFEKDKDSEHAMDVFQRTAEKVNKFKQSSLPSSF